MKNIFNYYNDSINFLQNLQDRKDKVCDNNITIDIFIAEFVKKYKFEENEELIKEIYDSLIIEELLELKRKFLVIKYKLNRLDEILTILHKLKFERKNLSFKAWGSILDKIKELEEEEKELKEEKNKLIDIVHSEKYYLYPEYTKFVFEYER